jgi:hypothetical protein
VSDRSNFQLAIKKAAKNWSTILVERAKKNAPRHLAPHIYTKVVQESPEKLSINLGVTMVDSFTSAASRVGAMPGAVTQGGSMDAAALEFGSEPHTIKPRKRTFKSGKVMKKYDSDKKTWLGVGMAAQRGWLVVPNLGKIPEGAGKGYRPNMTADGNFIFTHEVDHPGGTAYKNGRGYLRISIDETKDQMVETEKKSIAKAISMDILDKFRKSSKVMFIK